MTDSLTQEKLDAVRRFWERFRGEPITLEREFVRSERLLSACGDDSSAVIRCVQGSLRISLALAIEQYCA